MRFPWLARPFLVSLVALSALAATAPGCSSTPEEDEEGEEALQGNPLSASTIKSATAYKAFSLEGGGFGQSGRSMKFLIDRRDANAPAPNFINGNYKVNGKQPEYAKYHYYFAQKKLGITETNNQFNDATYFTQDKRFVAGTIQTYNINGEAVPTYAVQFYPDDVVNEQRIVDVLKVIKGSFTIPNAKMAFVATGPQQTTKTVKAAIQALGFGVYTIEEILGTVKYFPMNPGEAWGTLRIFPHDVDDLHPTDIPVFDELPLDLGVVAGTITRVFQDVTSHVNLKSKERGTPNMVFRDASPTEATLAPFANKPVHLTVGKDGFKLEPTTDAVIAQKLAERTNKPWIPLPVTAESRLGSYDDLCPTDGKKCLSLVPNFGGKAVGLAFLAAKNVLGRDEQSSSVSHAFGYDLTPHGFGIPVARYRDFVADPANAPVRQAIDALIAAEQNGNLSPNERKGLVDAVKNAILVGQLAPATLAAVTARIGEVVPGVNKFKIRSSSNAEDIPNFDGAGLYDSFSAELDKTDNPDGSCRIETSQEGAVTKSKVKPKTVNCAIKGVYASLWNARAVEERSFARLDHKTSGMGLAIVPAYDTEDDIVANAVVISRVVNADDIIGYTVSLQKGDNLVTNPDPGTIAQSTVATFAALDREPRLTLTRYAVPVAGQPALTDSVLPDAKVQEIVKAAIAVENAYCKAKGTAYYSGDCRYVSLDNEKPRALDLEVKVLANGHLIVKQTREFHGR